jgi:Domain of unknown function (DUF4157)
MGAVAQAKVSDDAPAEAGGESAAAAPAEAGHPLPDAVRIRMEEALKADFSAVRIHEGAEAKAMGARAFTRGTDIYFAPGEYDPSSERGLELIGHELAHVVQQGSGRVQATALAQGMAVNEDAGLEHEADVAGAGAARGEAAGGGEKVAAAPASPAASAPAQMKAETTVAQRKGDVKLMTQAGPTGDAPMADGVEELLEQMAAYDALTDGRPEQQLIHLEAMVNLVTGIVAAEPKPGKFKSFFSKGPAPVSLAAKLKLILVQELNLVTTQRDRLERFTATPEAPYEQMTAEGMLWSHPSFGDNTENIGKTGKPYFQELSSQNLGEMHVESATSEGVHPRPNTEAWFADFVARATAALERSVVNHYTTTGRARQMLAGGGMKSKVKLEKEAAEFKHNTSAYDDFVLANSGFLFFFIEAPEAGARGTRFADGDPGEGPARISIPIRESGLIDSGWIMLSDFAQREYPDIKTNATNDRHASWLSTRPEEVNRPRNAGMTESVRHFDQGIGDITPEDMAIMEDMSIPQAKRNVAPMASVQASGDPGSKQTYSGPGGEKEVPDHIRNNILVGSDIIPGLAMRAALEVSRISKVNPALAETMKGLAGLPLMTFMLKDLFRPQAMIPNSVEITEDHIQAG